MAVTFTNRTREQIISADWNTLNSDERIVRDSLVENPDMTLKEAEHLLQMLP